MADPRTNIRPKMDPIFTDKFFQANDQSIKQELGGKLTFPTPQNFAELQAYYNNLNHPARKLFTDGAHKLCDDIKAWATLHDVSLTTTIRLNGVRTEKNCIEEFKKHFDFSQDL